MATNGKLKPYQLRIVQRHSDGSVAKLTPKVKRAYLRLREAQLHTRGEMISIARPAGAYRSVAVQAAMKRNPTAWGLSSTSSVTLASAGHSSHGLGDRVDIVGAEITDDFIRRAQAHGFVREFGAADPNHFRYIGPAASK